MKNVLLYSLMASLALTFNALADDKKDKEKDLPPGLKKKEKLPPGWEKKQKDGTATVDSTSKSATTTAKDATNKVSTTAAEAKTPKQLKGEIDKHLEKINSADGGKKKVVLEAISNETGVPVDRLKEQAENRNLGTGGLLAAHVIAKESGKPFKKIVEQREGKSWAELAIENKVDLGKLNASMARVSQKVP